MTTSACQPPSADDCRQRFLIAVAKLLGENPVEADPSACVRICERWALEETVNTILRPGGLLGLNRDVFSRLMIQCGKRPVTEHFYQAFFAKAATIGQFEAAVERYRVKCMLLFGNFKYAYRTLATASPQKLQKLLEQTEPLDQTEFTKRPEFNEIERIPLEDRHLLGYISGGHQDLLFCLDFFQVLQGSPAVSNLGELGLQKQEKLSKVLREYGLAFDPDRIAEPAYLAHVTSRLQGALDSVKKRASDAMEMGQRNTRRYLSLPHLDVYVATSMEKPQDFASQDNFIREVFEHKDIKPLRLRYFDPTLSYADDRVTKGLIEALMLRRARVTIYNAGAKDTLGKDSELAATLAQGKPVIVYVAEGGDEAEKEILNSRAKKFLVDHPLGLQIDVNSGVAHGIIAVRSAPQCALLLRKVLLNQLELKIAHEGGNYRLCEADTGSVIRVVSDDPFLTHAFWTYFHDTRRRESAPEPRPSDRSAAAAGE